MAQVETSCAVPTRACAACRTRAPAARLLRFAHDGQRVVVDLDRTIAGRGMQLCPKRRCLAVALKKGAFQRAFGCSPSRQAASAEVELSAAIAAALVDVLVRLVSGALRGGLARTVRSESEGISALARLLRQWQGPDGVTLVAVEHPEMAERIAWLAEGVSEFTFPMTGGMQRRPQAPDAAQAGAGMSTCSEMA